MMMSFVQSFFPRDVLEEIFDLIESVFEWFPTYSFYRYIHFLPMRQSLFYFSSAGNLRLVYELRQLTRDT